MHRSYLMTKLEIYHYSFPLNIILISVKTAPGSGGKSGFFAVRIKRILSFGISIQLSLLNVGRVNVFTSVGCGQ